MRQHAAVSQLFDQQQKPLVTAGRFDRHLKLPQAGEERAQAVTVIAAKPLAADDFPPATDFRHHAHADSLLMEIRADKLHD